MTLEVQKMNLLRVAAVLALVGSAACAYHTPTEPSAPAVDLSAPSKLTIGVLTGTGSDGGTAAVTARVQNVNGAALANVAVTFTTTAGTIAPDRVMTGADGRATATLTATGTAQVIAAAGTLTAGSLVAVQPPVATSPTPTPTPTPGPTPIPTPLPTVIINVPSSATTGVPLTFNISSSAMGANWSWNFGDGTNAQTTAFAASHTYTKAGVYVATVSAPGVSSANATITVTDPAPVATTPSSALAATLTCTAGNNSTTKTACNVNLSYGGAALPAGNVTSITWDWGDGTTADNSGTTAVKTHQYASSGTFTVFATVTANTSDGSKTAPATSKSVVIP